MSDNKQSVSSILKQPFTIAIILIVIAIVIVWANQQSSKTTSNDVSEIRADAQLSSSDSALPLKPSTASNPGSNTPRIVANMNQQQKPAGSVAAPGLENLVKGLEDKVASDPGNINNRMLLAQTYNELGMQDKALAEMRTLQKDNPDNGRVSLILGSILSQSNDQESLKESLPLLEKASGDKTIQQYFQLVLHRYRYGCINQIAGS